MPLDFFEISPKDKINHLELVNHIANFFEVSIEKVVTHTEFWNLSLGEQKEKRLSIDIFYDDEDEYKTLVKGMATFVVSDKTLSSLARYIAEKCNTSILIGDYTIQGVKGKGCWLIYLPNGKILKAIDASCDHLKVEVVDAPFESPDNEIG